VRRRPESDERKEFRSRSQSRSQSRPHGERSNQLFALVARKERATIVDHGYSGRTLRCRIHKSSVARAQLIPGGADARTCLIGVFLAIKCLARARVKERRKRAGGGGGGDRWEGKEGTENGRSNPVTTKHLPQGDALRWRAPPLRC
jgi:hypothetical protein